VKIWKKENLVRFAGEKSPFYRHLYRDLDLDSAKFEDLPLVEQEQFWRSNKLENNQLMTGKHGDGVLFKSGGTTGNPKFSAFTRDEWEDFTQEFAWGMDQTDLEDGDKVANLFYGGDLYASFLFIAKGLEKSKKNIVHFPISGQCSFDSVFEHIKLHGINVLAGVPSWIVSLGHLLEKRRETLPVSKILYGGEGIYPDQIDFLKKVFPGVDINSIGYASVDGGHLGYRDRSCQAREHCVFKSTYMEILDSEGEPVLETGIKGELVYTNLIRSLVPIIRYKVGDVGEWTDVGHKFILRGRSDVGARLGPITINRDDIVSVLKRAKLDQNVSQFQLILERESHLDRLDILLDIKNDSAKKIEEEFIKALHLERPQVAESIEAGLIKGIFAKVVEDQELERNERTGKLKLLIDRRH
jgi:phenylacetate-CoA ligase